MTASYKIADFETKEALDKYLKSLDETKLRELFLLNQELIKRIGQEDLWAYQKARIPNWYKNNRTYLKKMCQTIQAVYEGKIINSKTGKPYKKVMLNAPPQFGKSLTMQGAISWFLGDNPNNRIISISYNEKLSSRVGKNIRDAIDETKLDPEKFVVNDFFPDTEINHTDASRTFWALKEQFFNFLGSSPTGTITGIGANIMMIDDLVKNAKEASNKRILEEQWNFYTDTLLSRAHEGALWFIIMTRWSTQDICGRLLEIEPDDWLVLNFEAYDESTDTMLSDDVMSKETYLDKKSKTSPKIFNANFHQIPVDEDGLLYDEFRTYFDRDVRYKETWGYCDPADSGDDSLSAGFVGTRENIEELHVLDWLHTTQGMEFTAPKLAERLIKYNIKRFYIEKNNASYFITKLQDFMRTTHPEWRGRIIPLHQSENKESRIISTAWDANRLLVFPDGWHSKWNVLHDEIMSYQRSGTNTHDDAPDVIAGLVEYYMTNGKKGSLDGYK